jgi:predicted ATPase/DNA-binding winged helix-turn-helix (wHTH) protein
MGLVFGKARGRLVDSGSQTYQFGEFALDVTRGCIFKAGEEIKLRPKVYETLKYLVEHPGRLIGKEELMKAVWPDSVVTDDSLVQCTVELRKALGDREHKLVKTVPRRGYLFIAEIVRVPPQTSSAPLTAPLAPDTTPSRTPIRGKRRGLPAVRTSLIGREREVSEAAELILRPEVKLLTITGPGGAGKTRLALAIASVVANHFAAGVQFVGLASIANPNLVETALAKALGIQQVPHRSVPELIGEQLESSGPLLLLIDNFEQVLTAATVLAETIAVCPSLKVLVTSRSGLRIYGEQEFPVSPLEQNSAVELFCQRAAAVSPSFAVTPENEPAIREICQRLDGLPLAIELAAARTKMLSPHAMLDKMRNRLNFLTAGAMDLPERQQTLRGTIDWSHDLLNESEQRLFRRLSVFVGGCTLESAEAVCNTNHDLGTDLFEGLSSLVDKNLIQRADQGRVDGSIVEPRFAMLETIREYALERLAVSGEPSAVRRAHAAYSLVLAEEGNPELGASDRGRWLSQCDAEIDNLRSALEWLFESNEIEWSLRLSLALFRFWDMREHLAEGRQRLQTALLLAGNSHSAERARVCQFIGALASAQGDYIGAEYFLEKGLSVYGEIADLHGIAASLNALGVSARDRGDYVSAETNFECSLACWRNLSDPLATARCLHNLASVLKIRGEYERAFLSLDEAIGVFDQLGDRSGAAWSINQQGDIKREQSDVAGARSLYQRSLAAFQEAGDKWGVARSLTDMGSIDSQEKDYESAQAAYREALKLFTGLGHRRGIARVIEGLGCLALSRGDASQALKLCGAATHLRRLIGAPLPPAEQSKLDQLLRPAWTALTEKAANGAWAEGFGMSLEKTMRCCLEESTQS